MTAKGRIFEEGKEKRVLKWDELKFNTLYRCIEVDYIGFKTGSPSIWVWVTYDIGYDYSETTREWSFEEVPGMKILIEEE